MKGLQKIFHFDAPSRLLAATLRRIDLEKIRRARREVMILASVTIASGGAVLAACIQAFRAVGASDLPQFFSLFMTDWKDIVLQWKPFLSAVGQAIPTMACGMLLLALLLMIVSMKRLGKIVLAFPALPVSAIS